MSANWLNKIISHEVTPPENAWANITNELDKTEITTATTLKERMQSHEEAPPAGILNAIFDTLDKDDLLPAPAYIERIKNYTEKAPASAWENITEQLDQEKLAAISSPASKKNTRIVYLRIAAAAAIAAIIIAIVPGIKQQQGIEAGNATVNIQSFKELLPQNIIVAPATKKVNLDKKNIIDKVAKEALHKKTADNNLDNYVKNIEIAPLAQDPTFSNKEKLQNEKGETPMDIALMNTPNTYISITGADGQTVKVSSKFSNLIGYLTDKNAAAQENIDVIIEESAKWRKIFSTWRDKMTNNSMAPSFSNFLDIIELSKILEEKNN